jgi:hypothetical protein
MLHHFFSDDESLNQYRNGEYVNIEDVKRRLFLQERQNNKMIPDQFFKLEQEVALQNIKSFNDFFFVGFNTLVDAFLYLKDKQIYVKNGKQNDFQELIGFVPPIFYFKKGCNEFFKK